MRAARSTEFVTPAAALATERVPLPPALSPLERAAWEGMLLIHALLLKQLDGELQLEQRLPLSHHDVLLKLSEAPGGQQRMSELANGVLLTKGGLTRVVDVLEKTGFVERVRSDEDGRGRYARLTPAGRARLQAAHPVHVRGVRALFLDKLSDEQLHCLVETWHAVLSDGRSRQPTLRHADPRRRREGEAAAARAIGATPTRSATALSISHPRFCIPHHDKGAPMIDTPTAESTPSGTIPADDPGRVLTHVSPDTDESLPHIGVVCDTHTILVSGADTAGRYTLIDMHVPPGGGPPPHRHDFEEMFTVLDGEIELTFRGVKAVATAGQTINVPANAPHVFRNVSKRPARLLCLCSLAGEEEFVKEVGEPVAHRTEAPPALDDAARRAFIAKAIALAPKYRTELLLGESNP